MKGLFNAMVRRTPWWAKVGAKVVLSRLPIDYGSWKRIGLFQHGTMEEPVYAFQTFRRHFDYMQHKRPMDGFVGLELGPGDSLLSAMMAYAFGAKSYYLVDVGPFATSDMKSYQTMAAMLKDMELRTPHLSELTLLDALLAACGARYATDGLSSLRAIPDGSVDRVWSQAVFEHLPRADFVAVMRELRRIIRPNGVASHVVDLQDHMGGRLNHLRFSERVWESRFMSTSGFYTNRIRYSEMQKLFTQARFAVDVVDLKRWDHLPTPRMKLWSGFRDLSDEDLRVSGFHTILTPV